MRLLRRRKQLRRKISSQAMLLIRINRLPIKQELLLLRQLYHKKPLRRILLILLLLVTQPLLLMLLKDKEKELRHTITKEEEPLHKLEIH